MMLARWVRRVEQGMIVALAAKAMQNHSFTANDLMVNDATRQETCLFWRRKHRGDVYFSIFLERKFDL